MISNEDKFWSTLINYHPIIHTIYELTKSNKNNIPLRPIISGIGTAPNNIAKFIAKNITSSS